MFDNQSFTGDTAPSNTKSYAILAGEMPFTGADELQVYVAILTQSPKLDIIDDDAAVDLLEGLLSKDPSERADHDPDHPFYKGFEEPVTNENTQLISHVGIPIKRPQ
jgi:serine/threonine protein kinase